MNIKNQERIKIIFILCFFLLNIINCYLLTTDVFLRNLSPYPRDIFMITNSFLGDFGFLVVLFSIAVIIIKTDYNRIKYLMYVSIFLSIIYIGLTIYFGYYGMIFSFYNLKAFDSPGAGNAFKFLLDSLLILSVNAKPFFLMSAVTLIFLFLWFFRRHRRDQEFRSQSIVKGANRLSIGLSMFAIGILLMASSLSSYRVQIEDTWHKDNKTPLFGAQSIGLLNFYVYDAYNYFFTSNEDYNVEQITKIKQKIEELKESIRVSKIDNMQYGNNENYTGIFKDKNLLLIQVESLNNFTIGLKVEIDGEMVEITPNLNRILDKSVYYNNYYANVGIGNTSDAEFTNLTGIYPVGPSYTVYEYNKVQYQTLPKLFRDEGYYTYSVHANTGIFYERSSLHPGLYGFDKHFAEENLNVSSEQLLHTWLNDLDMLRQSIDIMKEESANGPVFSFTITITNHMPYGQPTDNGKNSNWFNGKNNLFPEGFKLVNSPTLNNQLIGYLEHVSYTDYALGEAFKYLEETGLADNTIVMLYGDHGCGIRAYEMFYENPHLFSNEINPIIEANDSKLQILLERKMLSNVPLIIYDPAYNEESILKAQTIPLVRGFESASRTISNLFGLNPVYYFGVDALSDAVTFTYNPRTLDIFADGIVISATSKEYVITDPTYQDFYTTEKIDSIIQAFLEYKDFNDKILKYEIFPKTIASE